MQMAQVRYKRTVEPRRVDASAVAVGLLHITLLAREIELSYALGHLDALALTVIPRAVLVARELARQPVGSRIARDYALTLVTVDVLAGRVLGPRAAGGVPCADARASLGLNGLALLLLQLLHGRDVNKWHLQW